MFAQCPLSVRWPCRTSFWIRTHPRGCRSLRRPMQPGESQSKRAKARSAKAKNVEEGSAKKDDAECDCVCCWLSWKIPCANRLTQLFDSEHVIGERLAVR